MKRIIEIVNEHDAFEYCIDGSGPKIEITEDTTVVSNSDPTRPIKITTLHKYRIPEGYKVSMFEIAKTEVYK
jgi:hypothetical protein